MINETNTELFVELSDEQQQLVAGGYSYESPSGITDIVNTNLNEHKSIKEFSFGIASTCDGSVVTQDYSDVNYDFDTSASKYFTDK